jgi:peptide/nickel transport system substrate-binding protein
MALYTQWFNSGGKNGEEPPQVLKDLYDKIQKWVTLKPGSDEYLALGKEILTIHTQNLWYIGTSVAPRVVIISNKLGNTPTEGTFAADYAFWKPYKGHTWYFK